MALVVFEVSLSPYILPHLLVQLPLSCLLKDPRALYLAKHESLEPLLPLHSDYLYVRIQGRVKSFGLDVKIYPERCSGGFAVKDLLLHATRDLQGDRSI